MFRKRLWCVHRTCKLAATSNYVERLRRARWATQEAHRRNPLLYYLFMTPFWLCAYAQESGDHRDVSNCWALSDPGMF